MATTKRASTKIFLDIAFLVGSACTTESDVFQQQRYAYVTNFQPCGRRVQIRVPINTYVLSRQPADICRRPRRDNRRHQIRSGPYCCVGNLLADNPPLAPFQVNTRQHNSFQVAYYIVPSREDEIRMVGCRGPALLATSGSILIGC